MPVRRLLLLTGTALVAAVSPAAASTDVGGASYVEAAQAPVGASAGVDLLDVSPTEIPADRMPDVRFRITLPDVDQVSVRVVVTPLGSTQPDAAVRLGEHETGQLHAVRWPQGTSLEPGRYVVRLHATSAGGRRTPQRAHASAGRAITVVEAVPDAPTPGTDAPGTSTGVFPIAGAYAWGGNDARFGAPRGDRAHQGQDLPAVAGTPVVAPTAGTVVAVDFQRDGAGYYVAMRSVDGRDFFFAHLRKGTTAATVGQAVTQARSWPASDHRAPRSAPTCTSRSGRADGDAAAHSIPSRSCARGPLEPARSMCRGSGADHAAPQTNEQSYGQQGDAQRAEHRLQRGPVAQRAAHADQCHDDLVADRAADGER